MQLDGIIERLVKNIDIEKLHERIGERGVECLILTPLLVDVLKYDPLLDIEFQKHSATMNNQIYDFLVKGGLLIEAKKIFSEIYNNDYVDQVKRYLINGDDFKFGILTNGIRYMIYMKYDKDIYLLADLSFAEDYDFCKDVLKLFGKDKIESSYNQIAKYVERLKNGGAGKHPKLIKGKIDHDNKLKKIIKEKIIGEKGYYYDAIKRGEMNIGDYLEFCIYGIYVKLKIESGGCVRIVEFNIKDFIQAQNFGLKDYSGELVREWNKENPVFQDPKDIIKRVTGKRRVGRDIYNNIIKL